MEVSQHSRFNCVFCGKDNIKRQVVGIWKCGTCRRVIAGGAYQLANPQAITVKTQIARLRKFQQEGGAM
jgi:large subunit ribosomal protein L37Ae